MSADPFTAASPTYQRAIGRGVRMQPLMRSGRVWPGTWRGHLIAAFVGVGFAILALAVWS